MECSFASLHRKVHTFHIRRSLRTLNNMRAYTVAVFTLVSALFLIGLLMDVDFLRHFVSVTNIDRTNTLESVNKHHLTHSAVGRQTKPNTDAKDRAINDRNSAISPMENNTRAINHRDIGYHGTTLLSLACPWNSTSPPLGDKIRQKYEIHDLFRVRTPDFLSNYKNPCWKQDKPNKLVCLPYFFLIGFPKCGTTFTFNTIVGHPEAVKGRTKEPHWITRKRFKESSRLPSYLNCFSPAATVIESEGSIDPLTGQKSHPLITGDGSASTAWHNPYWRYLPGNYNCTEPRVLTPDYIYHLNPSTKVIILVRNPTDRMISGYNYFTRGPKTANSFHVKMVQDLRTFEDCCSKYSLRLCAYDVDVRLRIGLYHVFIRDWLKVFPADQVLIVRLEDMHDDPYRVFTRIFDFLGLREVSEPELQGIINNSRMNAKSKTFQAKNETRRLLDDFYRPHNIQLAGLLQQHDPSLYSNIHDNMYSH